MNMESKIPVERLKGADKREEGTYTRPLTADEKATISETIAKVAEEEHAHAEARKDAMADMRERAKELATERKELLRQKRTGHIEVTDTLYTFLALEERTAYTYNSEGELTGSRRMTADEFQLAIPEGVVPMKKAANNG